MLRNLSKTSQNGVQMDKKLGENNKIPSRGRRNRGIYNTSENGSLKIHLVATGGHYVA